MLTLKLPLKQWRAFFWNIDPGYFNLKHAFKTILAIGLSLWFVRHSDLFTLLLAGIGSGFSMQGIPAKTKSSRLIHILAFDAVCFSTFSLGLWVRDSANMTSILLVLLGFFANYIRRFNLEWGAAPMMAWSLTFLAVILPFHHTAEAWQNIYGLLVGFMVSGLIIFFIFPENYARLLIDNVCRFFETLSLGIHDSRQLILKSDVDIKHAPCFQAKIRLMQLLERNQTIQHDLDNYLDIQPVLNQLYSVYHAYELMIESLCLLHPYQKNLPRASRLLLCRMSKQLENRFAHMRMDRHYSILTTCPMSYAPFVEKKPLSASTTQPEIILALLNFKLSIDLLNEQQRKLLRNLNEH